MVNVENQGNTLAKDGITIVENYLDEEVCAELYEKLSSSISNGGMDVVEGEQYEYDELVNWGGPVANKRTGRDDGMIDVFNADMVVPEILSFKTDETVGEIINRASEHHFTPDNVNIYWNRSVTSTRDLHADTYSGKYKSFVYLTDVPDSSYGPLCYIKGTHRSSKVKDVASSLVNKLRGSPSTDAVFYDMEDVVRCTASKGTLIIADQSGYHRGYPQQTGRERMLMNTSYTPAN